VLRVLRHRAKRVEFRFGRPLHESPKRAIREIETHEVCPGRETAPGFFMSAIRRPERKTTPEFSLIVMIQTAWRS
jgi:hypothetical protein